jgi:hypothetical protein
MDGCGAYFYKYNHNKSELIGKIDLSKLDNLDILHNLDKLYNIFIETKYISFETEYIGFSYKKLMEILKRFTHAKQLSISGRPFDMSLQYLPKTIKCLDLCGLVNMDIDRKKILDGLIHKNNLQLISINIADYFNINRYTEPQNTEYKIIESHITNIPYIKTLRKIKLVCFDEYDDLFEENIKLRLLDSELLRFYKNKISSIKFNLRKEVVIIKIFKYCKYMR